VLGVVHRDRYPVELADPRHAEIVPDSPAGWARPAFEAALTRC